MLDMNAPSMLNWLEAWHPSSFMFHSYFAWRLAKYQNEFIGSLVCRVKWSGVLFLGGITMTRLLLCWDSSHDQFVLQMPNFQWTGSRIKAVGICFWLRLLVSVSGCCISSQRYLSRTQDSIIVKCLLNADIISTENGTLPAPCEQTQVRNYMTIISPFVVFHLAYLGENIAEHIFGCCVVFLGL